MPGEVERCGEVGETPEATSEHRENPDRITVLSLQTLSKFVLSTLLQFIFSIVKFAIDSGGYLYMNSLCVIKNSVPELLPEKSRKRPK